MPPGSNFPNIRKPEMRKTLAGIKVPQSSKILASMWIDGLSAMVAQIFGILRKIDPCRCFQISGFMICWEEI